MKKKPSSKKTAPKTAPTASSKRDTPAAAYDGAPSQLAAGSPVFVRWDVGQYKLGILTGYDKTGAPVVRIGRTTPKGAYTADFAKPAPFKFGEVSRVYMERDWESMTRPNEMDATRAIDLMRTCARRAKKAEDTVKRLDDPKVIEESRWIIEAICLASAGGEGIHGHSDFDARMSRGPATDELQQPRSQNRIDNDVKRVEVIDMDIAEDVVSTILENRPVHIETLRSLARWVGTCHQLIGDWKARSESFEAQLESATADETGEQIQLGRGGIIDIKDKRAWIPVRIDLISNDGEIHYVDHEGVGGSRNRSAQGKEWRLSDTTVATFQRMETEWQAKNGSTYPAPSVNPGDRIAFPIGHGRFDYAKVTAVGYDANGIAESFAFRRDDGKTGNRKLEPSTYAARKKGEPDWCFAGDDAPPAPADTTPIVSTDGPARGSKIQIRSGDGWSLPISVLKVENGKVLFGRLGRTPKDDRIDGAYRTSERLNLWRPYDQTLEESSVPRGTQREETAAEVAATLAATPAANDGPTHGSMTGVPIEVKVGKAWVRGMAAGNNDVTMMINWIQKGRDGDLKRAEMFNLVDEGKTWRRLLVMPNPSCAIDVKTGRTWERVNCYGVIGSRILFRSEDGVTEGETSDKEHGKRWRHVVDRCAETTAVPHADIVGGSPCGGQLCGKIEGRWMCVYHHNDVIRGNAPSAPVKGTMVVTSEKVGPPIEESFLDEPRREHENPLMRPKDAAKKLEQGRRAVESSGSKVVEKTVLADSPVDRAVAAATKPLTLRQRQIKEADMRGVSIEVIQREHAETQRLADEAVERERGAEMKRDRDRDSAGIDRDGNPVTMPNVGDVVHMATVDGWTPTKVLASKNGGFSVLGSSFIYRSSGRGHLWRYAEGPDDDELSVASDDELRDIGKERLADGTIVERESVEREPAPWEDGFGDTPIRADDADGQPEYQFEERPPWE